MYKSLILTLLSALSVAQGAVPENLNDCWQGQVSFLKEGESSKIKSLNVELIFSGNIDEYDVLKVSDSKRDFFVMYTCSHQQSAECGLLEDGGRFSFQKLNAREAELRGKWWLGAPRAERQPRIEVLPNTSELKARLQIIPAPRCKLEREKFFSKSQ